MTRVDLALISVAFIWGATFVLVKEALDDVSTLLFLAMRFAVAAAALALLFARKLRPTRDRTALLPGMLAGLCLFAGYVLQTFGLKYTTPAKAGFLTGLYIPLVPLLGALVYKKIPKRAEVLGVSAAFAGMALMTVQRDLFSISLGDGLVAGCAVAYAIHILVLGHYAGKVDVPLLTVTQIATAAVLAAGTCWWAEAPRLHPSGRVWLALLVTSFLATAAAFLIQTWAQQYTTPTRTALIFSMEPVFAWVTSYVLLGETLTARALTGAALILVGIILVELRGNHP